MKQIYIQQIYNKSKWWSLGFIVLLTVTTVADLVAVFGDYRRWKRRRNDKLSPFRATIVAENKRRL